jgi:hypothetical protein
MKVDRPGQLKKKMEDEGVSRRLQTPLAAHAQRCGQVWYEDMKGKWADQGKLKKKREGKEKEKRERGRERGR